jgi:hypothetical protein
MHGGNRHDQTKQAATGGEEENMIRTAKDFDKFSLQATDGEIGHVSDFYFDDRHWNIRYLVAETGSWLRGRQVLILPTALHPANEADRVQPVDLTKKQIEDSPPIETHQPVSRQFEDEYFAYYGWPYSGQYGYGYGLAANTNGFSPLPYGMPTDMMQTESPDDEEFKRRKESWDADLRSTGDARGHSVEALDGEIGHVHDFVIDDETWDIRYLIVHTTNWFGGRHVLISPKWIKEISWAERKIVVNLTREAIRQSPEYTPQTLDRDYESALHEHYGSEPAEKLAGPTNTSPEHQETRT